MKLHIYLFRHGQTYYNRARRFTGWKDSKLTPLGRKQARIIANKLKDKKIDVAYQTRLSRSQDTLRPVLKFHPECKKIITDNRLIERSYGRLQGKSHKHFAEMEGMKDYRTLLHWHQIDLLRGEEKEEFIKRVGEAELQVIRRSYDARPPHGESIKMVEKRVLNFIHDLLKKVKNEKINVAISAHGNSMRPFRRYFEKASIKTMMTWEMPYDDYFDYTINV